MGNIIIRRGEEADPFAAIQQPLQQKLELIITHSAHIICRHTWSNNECMTWSWETNKLMWSYTSIRSAWHWHRSWFFSLLCSWAAPYVTVSKLSVFRRKILRVRPILINDSGSCCRVFAPKFLRIQWWVEQWLVSCGAWWCFFPEMVEI